MEAFRIKFRIEFALVTGKIDELDHKKTNAYHAYPM